MKSRTTIIWFALAASLAGFVWVVQTYLQPAVPVSENVLPGLRGEAVEGIQVIPAGALAVGAQWTNGAWQLEPGRRGAARVAAVKGLLQTLSRLTPAGRITAEELAGRTNPAAEFGLESPQFSVNIRAGGQQWQLRVGNRTAPGDQVYLQLVGARDILVADAGWLSSLPRTMDDWRDDALLAVDEKFDWILITNGTKVIELRQDGVQGWRIIQPLPVRADNERIVAALRQLHQARVAAFVTDDPHADLAGYGLQPADLDVWLGRGTNGVTGFHAGKALIGSPDRFYVRREGQDAVVAAGGEVLAPWRAMVNEFRDPHVLPRLAVPPEEIELTGTNGFVLRRKGADDWSLVGSALPVSTPAVQELVKALDALRITEFVKDNNTAADLQRYGLNPPVRQVILRAHAGDTNSLLASVAFGAADAKRIYAKGQDGNSVYALELAPLQGLLQKEAWEFRDRRVWHFAETNIARIILQQGGKTREILNLGGGRWLPAGEGVAGLDGFDAGTVTAAVTGFEDFTVPGWAAHAVARPEDFGVRPDSLHLIFLLKSGEKREVDFGLDLNQSGVRTALAAVELNGETWICVFPPVLFQYVLAALTVPSANH